MSADADFVWCGVRDNAGGHICSDHRPSHTQHVCCCGAIIQPSDEPAVTS